MENHLLRDFKVAVLVTDGFEESELTVPVQELREAGAKVHVISPGGGPVQGFKHHDKSLKLDSDRKLDEVQPGEYDAVLLPGGTLNADALRTEKAAQRFVRAFDNAGKPIAAICHGPWLLVSAGLVKGRELTSWPSIADDIRNAGAQWSDQEVLVDGNLVTSRKPDDLPAFCRELCRVFAESGVTRRDIAA